MSLCETLVAVWQQVMIEKKRTVELGEARYAVRKTGSKRLRGVDFEYEGHRLSGIEQNPRTTSRWADLARAGQRVMQFSYRGRYIGNVCEGKLLRYPAWQASELPH